MNHYCFMVIEGQQRVMEKRTHPTIILMLRTPVVFISTYKHHTITTFLSLEKEMDSPCFRSPLKLSRVLFPKDSKGGERH